MPSPDRRLLYSIAKKAASGPWNMALDEALFLAARSGEGNCFVRIYRWSRPTLSIGFAQSYARAVDELLAERGGVPVVRRITGGKAVLHDREYTYAVALPYALVQGKDKSLAACYGVVARSLIAALRRLGIAATRAGRRPGRSSSEICFRSAAEHEILVSGRKLVGSAQRRGLVGFLQHGSILIDANGCGSSQRGSASGLDAIGLGELLARPPTPGRLCRFFAQELASRLGLEAVPGELPAAKARELLRKHRSQDWIGRVP